MYIQDDKFLFLTGWQVTDLLTVSKREGAESTRWARAGQIFDEYHRRSVRLMRARYLFYQFCGWERKGKKKKTEQIFFSRLTRIDFLPFQFDNTRLSSRAAVYTHYLGPYLGFLQLYVYLDGCVQQSDTCFYRLYSSHFTFFYFLYYASEFITQTTSIQNCTGAQTPLHLPCLNI